MAGGRQIKVLNVAEKPSVAKSVATILSRNQGLRVREGRSRYNKIFEFNYDIRGQSCHMLVTSVTGHLMELDFDERYRKWQSCDPVDLYHAPVRKFVPEDKMDIKRTLEEEARRCQWLVLWLDCDREGENIAFEVVEVCTAVNRHLTIKRARFSALIERDIHEAVQNLVQPNKWFADAVDARQEIDLRIGASFTRFQTMLLKDVFVIDSIADDKNVVLSYGPCQFPTLGFIVERYWEIQSHEPEEFWMINCSHNSDDGISTFSWMRGHLFDYTCAVLLYEMCVQEPAATVINVKRQESRKYPPHPLNTIELEKRASRYFRMSSEHTMKVAEDLYQAGFISYPRTETDCFSQRTDLHAIVQEQQGHQMWGAYAQRLLDPGAGLWRNPVGGGHDDKAHPPIHPTKFSAGEHRWSQDHHRLYELVVRHFLACVSQPAVGAVTTVEIDIAGELFSTSGREILARNYLDVYRFESWGGSTIPTYASGQQFIPTTLTLDSGVTRPPPLLSEADLLACMDKGGIGTDATMHDHIKKQLDRFYATKDSNTRFSPTKLGEALVMGYDDIGYQMWKPHLRAIMEHEMRTVSEGTKSKVEVLSTSLQEMKTCFLNARLNKLKLLEAMDLFFERSNGSGGDAHHVTGEVVRRCGLCQDSNMALKKNRDGNYMVGCLGFPQCRNVVWLPGSIAEAVVTTNSCNSCTPGPVYLIQFKFRQLEIPPNYNADHLVRQIRVLYLSPIDWPFHLMATTEENTAQDWLVHSKGCIGGCDHILRQLTEICGTGTRVAARGRGVTSSSSNIQRGNTRQNVCLSCHQIGHSSNDCPSQAAGSRSAHRRSSGESTVSCSNCGMACVLRTANTANNRGRKFYSCQSQECNFFVWEENVNGGNGGSNIRCSSASNRGRERGRGRTAAATFVSATGEPISHPRCFVCGDPSHFANVCPNRVA